MIGRYELSELEEDIDEPVTLAEVKAYSMIDADYSSDDDVIGVLISTARERLEQYLNVGLVKRNVQIQWNGYPIDLPLSPNADLVTLVDKDDVEIDADDYTYTPYSSKKIWINSLTVGGTEWFYHIDGGVSFWNGGICESDTIYTLVYNTGYETLPKALKQALLAEVDYLLKLRGLPVTDLISPNAKLLANGYSKNLVL